MDSPFGWSSKRCSLCALYGEDEITSHICVFCFTGQGESNIERTQKTNVRSRGYQKR